MVLKLEQFNLEELSTKNTTKLLRHMITRPYLAFGLTELSYDTKISKSNLLRILNVLTKHKLVIENKNKRKKVFRINSEMDIINEFWKMFMIERKYNLPFNIKNALDLVYNQIKNDVEMFIVFGSVAQGLSTERSDIDICVIANKNINKYKYDFLPYRLEFHNYSWDDIKNPLDFVVLESLMHGIVYKGDIFNLISNTRFFPKNYLIYRLENAKHFIEKAESSSDDAADYFKQIAEVTLGEIKSVMYHGTTIPKKEIKIENVKSEILTLEKEISKEGNNIWL